MRRRGLSTIGAAGRPAKREDFLSWLDAPRHLSWKALSDAYYEEYQVGRSVESLREKIFLLPFWPAARATWGHGDARGSHRSGKNG
jgi:hypothetical protein